MDDLATLQNRQARLAARLQSPPEQALAAICGDPAPAPDSPPAACASACCQPAWLMRWPWPFAGRMNGTPPQTTQMRPADLSGAAAAEAQQRQANLATRRASLDHQGASLRAEVLAAEASRNAGFSEIDARIRDDDRHVAPARGLFADATAFMRLINPHSPLDGLRANDDRVTPARLLTVAEVAQARARCVSARWQPQASVPGAGGVERGDGQAAMGR